MVTVDSEDEVGRSEECECVYGGGDYASEPSGVYFNLVVAARFVYGEDCDLYIEDWHGYELGAGVGVSGDE